MAQDSQRGTLIVVLEHDYQGVTRLLEQEGFRVISAGAQLREQIRAEQPDAILLAGTPAACQTIRRAEPSLPLIGLLLPDTQTAVQEAALYEAGADDVMFLPPERSALMRLRALVANKKRHDESQRELATLRSVLAETERELAHAQMASQEFTLLKDRMVHIVAHEMSTPLVQVKGAVTMLDSSIRAMGDINGLDRLLNFANQSTTRLENVLMNIKELSTAIKVKTEPDPFSVGDVINIARRQLERAWATMNQVHRIRFEPGQTPLITSNKHGIGQVLRQLIENGLKFSEPPSPVEVSTVALPAGVQFAVRDYGIGIPAEYHNRIFEAFYQIDSSSTRRYGGSGVGLAIVKLILDKLSIGVELESAPGAGSTFRFTVPCYDPAPDKRAE